MKERLPIENTGDNRKETTINSSIPFSNEEILAGIASAQKKNPGVSVDRNLLADIAKSTQKYIAQNNLVFTQARNYALKEHLAQFGEAVSRKAYATALSSVFSRRRGHKIASKSINTTTNEMKNVRPQKTNPEGLSEEAKKYKKAHDEEI